jgi:hypothetical protein
VRQGAGLCFFLSPQENACAETVGLDKPLHEFDLIDAGLEKEAREVDQLLLAEVATAI